MKNIKNYKMSEINWKEHFADAKLYSTNQPGKCGCGCVGSYEYPSIDEVAALLPEGDFKVFNMDEANDAEYKIPVGKGYYDGNYIFVKLGSHGKPKSLDYWKSRKLIIRLNEDVEKSL